MAEIVVEKVVNKLCKNKNNLNLIHEYLAELPSVSNGNLIKFIQIFDDVFHYYSKQGLVSDFDKEVCETTDGGSSSSKINNFLSASFRSYFEIMLEKLQPNVPDIEVLVVDTLMKCLKLNYILFFKRTAAGKESLKLNFPNNYFKKVVQAFLCNMTTDELKQKFEEYMSYDDLCYYALKNIYAVLCLQTTLPKECKLNQEAIHDILTIAAERSIDEEEDDKVFFTEDDYFINKDVDYSIIKNNFKSAFSSAWIEFLRQKNLAVNMQKKILVTIDTKVIPYLKDPKLLIDFLTDSYNMGGVHSLLALNGLFVLMNDYNLDYPDFYKRLYSLLSPNIFYVKYKSRFFHMLDLFLSSTHLPSYLIAAFIKKMARISLFTPVDDMEMLLVFIKNLFIRHPSTQVLIHRNNVKIDGSATDPYNYDQLDPAKCNAIKSCLWELNTLREHYSSEVMKQIQLFRKDFPRIETDLGEYLDWEFEDILDLKMNFKGTNEIPLNFQREKGILKGSEDNLWEFE